MVVPQTQRPALSGTALKRLALCSMLLDHLGASCLEAGVFSRPGPISEPLLTLDACGGPGGWRSPSTASCWWRASCTPTASGSTPGGCWPLRW